MQDQHIAKIAAELNLAPRQVKAVAGLLDEGGTVPFIARYQIGRASCRERVSVVV